jgi:hypothetical protein
MYRLRHLSITPLACALATGPDEPILPQSARDAAYARLLGGIRFRFEPLL